MKIGKHNTNDAVFVIAELGNNHEGDIEVAEKLIIEAAAAGVDAVKVQIFRTELYVAKSDNKRFDLLKKFELTANDFARLAGLAHELGVEFISTPFDLESAKVAADISDALKIASGDNTFFPLIDAVAGYRKPTILSTGLLNGDELCRPYEILTKALGKDNVALLHCVTSYPVEPKNANIGAIHALAKQFDCTIGYSDHTIGSDACLAAVSCGAQILEKHFTLDHNFSDFRDHQLSAEPLELKELVEKVRRVSLLLGEHRKNVADSEHQIKSAVRRSVVVLSDLPKGHAVNIEDLTWVRPAGGMQPGEEKLILGRRLRHPVSAGHQLSLDDFEGPAS